VFIDSNLLAVVSENGYLYQIYLNPELRGDFKTDAGEKP
jgi:hypothetical protein